MKAKTKTSREPVELDAYHSPESRADFYRAVLELANSGLSEPFPDDDNAEIGIVISVVQNTDDAVRSSSFYLLAPDHDNLPAPEGLPERGGSLGPEWWRYAAKRDLSGSVIGPACNILTGQFVSEGTGEDKTSLPTRVIALLDLYRLMCVAVGLTHSNTDTAKLGTIAVMEALLATASDFVQHGDGPHKAMSKALGLLGSKLGLPDGQDSDALRDAVAAREDVPEFLRDV